jgi:glycosyltransferase involved in cell wall biosynthesis
MSSILVVTERYWPDGGGGELATHLIINILRKRFNVVVVTGTRNASKASGVEYIYEPLLSKREKPMLWMNTLRLINNQRFQKLLDESDIVYIPRFAFPIVPFAKKLGKKVVVHLHGYIPISYTATVLAPYEEHKHRIALDNIALECMKSIKHCVGVSLLWWLPKLARKWISQADKILCVSRRQAEIIADQMPELKDKIEVVYNPLPPEIIDITPRKELDDISTFLYVGGDSYIKGFHILLQALSKLGKQGVKARFILAGEYKPRSLETIRQLCVKYRNLNIQVLNRVEYEKLRELHMKVWALLFPSISEETFGYAVVEASILSTIPIASNVSVIQELLGDTAASKFLFTPNNYLELARKIVEVGSLSTGEVVSLGELIKKEISEKFSMSFIEREILETFNGILK